MTATVNSLVAKLGLKPFGTDNECTVDFVNSVISAEAFWTAVAAGKPLECRPIIARFGRYVQPHPTSCWLWTGSLTGSWKGGSHGQFALYHGENIYAHRFAYLIFNGPINAPVVRHSCDVGRCVRPSHLLSGTQADNLRDAVERQRFPKFHVGRKLSSDQVIEMRRLRQLGWTLLALAGHFSVSKPCCSQICAGKRRTHLAPAGHVTKRRAS